MAKAKVDFKTQVTNQLIELIEKAQAEGTDWTMPFQSIAGRPHNAITGTKYRGFNAFWLMMMGQHTVAGYAQWLNAGWQVQKGSKAITITAPIPIKDKETNEQKGLFFRAVNVFSSDDVLNIETGEPWKSPELPTVDLTERLAIADQYIANLGATIHYTNEGRAFYRPADDSITMPHRELFTATDTSDATQNFYGVLFHEHTHWTGHKSRKDRLDVKNKKGRAFEELIAEIGAAFLSNQLGISSSPREDHAQYLANWLGALNNDKDYIFQAASKAQAAVDFMDSLQTKTNQKAA
jgi:antirestriction protein ArdC